MRALHSRTVSPAVGTIRSVRSVCRATGFGKSNKKPEVGGSGIYTAPKTKKRVNLVEELGINNKNVTEETGATADPERDLSKGNWFDLANVTDFQGDKKRKICELKGNKTTVLLHLFNDTIYATDAYSTAYQYPLIDAKLEDTPEGPTITTPLDGTIYALKTGKVIKWVPSDGSAIRGLLRTLKSDLTPVPLPVYPVVVKPDGKVMVRLSK